jgi:prepilin-type processing-associated H-X9-DG protein
MSTAQFPPPPEAPAPPRGGGRNALVWGLTAWAWVALAAGGMLFMPLLLGAFLGVLWALYAGLAAVRRGRRALRDPSANRRQAVAGMVLGGVGFLLAVAAIYGLVLAFLHARQKALQNDCECNVKQLGLAAIMYASDHGDRLPPAGDWPAATYPYIKNREIYRCDLVRRRRVKPGGESAIETDYTMNAALSGVSQADISHPEQVPLFWDGTALQGGAETVAYRHEGRANVVFADGETRAVTREEFQRLRLTPKP